MFFSIFNALMRFYAGLVMSLVGNLGYIKPELYDEIIDKNHQAQSFLEKFLVALVKHLLHNKEHGGKTYTAYNKRRLT